MLHKRQHNWIAQFTFSYLHMQDSSHLSNYLYKFVILIYLFSLFCVPAQEYNVHLRNFQKILIQVFNHIFFKETLVFLVFALSPFFPSFLLSFLCPSFSLSAHTNMANLYLIKCKSYSGKKILFSTNCSKFYWNNLKSPYKKTKQNQKTIHSNLTSYIKIN